MDPLEPPQPLESSYERSFEPSPSIGRVALFAFGGVLLAAVLFLVVVMVMLHA